MRTGESHANADRDSNRNSHADSYAYCDGNSYAHTDSYANGHSNSYAYTDSYAYGHSNSNSDSDCYCDVDVDAYGPAETKPDTKAAPDSAAAAVACSAIWKR